MAKAAAKDKGWIGGVVALWVTAAFLFVTIPALYLHSDEELSYRATNGTIVDTIRWQTSLQDNQAPLWFVLFNGWRGTVGDHEYTARMFGALLVMPALAFAYRIGRRAFGSSTAGAIGVFVLTGNHLFFNYAMDIRPYPLVMLAAAFSTWAFQRWSLRDRRQNAILYGVSVAVLLYTHYLLIFLTMAHAVYLIFAHRLTRARLIHGVMSITVAVVLFLPWLPVAVSHVNHLRNLEAETGTGRGIAGIGVSTQATSSESIMVLLNAATNGLAIVYVPILIVGMVMLIRRRGYWLALTWAILTPAVYLIANLIAAVYAPRFVSHALLGLGIAVGGALTAIAARTRYRIGSVTAWGLAFALVGLNLFTFGLRTEIPPRTQYRDVFREMNQQAAAGDAVLFYRGGEEDPEVIWNIDHYLDAGLADSITIDPAAAQEARRVWFVTRDWFGEGVQDAFHMLEATHPLQSVIGQCTTEWCYLAQLMESPPNAEPIVFGGVLPFYGADVTETSGAIRVRLWWRADEPPPRDYSISIQVIDAALIAQDDGAIRHYGESIVQTSAMQPGQIYIDERTISLSTPLPEDYQIVLVVYQSWDGVRLLLPDGADALLLSR